jgi:hypothetical protein
MLNIINANNWGVYLFLRWLHLVIWELHLDEDYLPQ